jgi:hypothetical protein
LTAKICERYSGGRFRHGLFSEFHVHHAPLIKPPVGKS